METLVIDRLGHRGDGIAHGPVFVPGALPGETVEGIVTDGVMADPRIVQPVPDRVRPPCRHARSCGGCQLQHASDGFVEGWKLDVVRTALAAQGLDAPVSMGMTSPPQSRRRAAFSARRTKKGALAGFHQKGSDVVVAVPDCQLVTPELAASLPMVEALAVLGASRKGELSALVTHSQSGLDVTVSGGKPIDLETLAEIAREHDLARIAWGEEVLTRRPPFQRFDGVEVVPQPGAFLQATESGEIALRDAVKHILQGARHVADLFAGCGTFALPLSREARVHAVEGDKAMIRALDHGWRHGQELRHVTHEARDLFRNPLLPDELARFDGVVIDPPRAGAEAQIAQLAAARIPRIAHVSCNPVTFARDAQTLIRAGYALGPVAVVDQFRWSTHVELVAGFTLTK